MNNVQAVFDKVIEAGFYSEFTKHGHVLMCLALKNSARNGIISKEEFILATEEIRVYLGPFGSLGGFLAYNNQPWHLTARLEIYKNWVNRPLFGVSKRG